MCLVVPYTVTSFGIAVISEEAKVFFTKNGEGTVNVVHADGSDRSRIFRSEQNLLGLAIDLKQR